MVERLSLDSLVEQVIDERDDTMREVHRLRAEVKRRDVLLGRAVVYVSAYLHDLTGVQAPRDLAEMRQLLAEIGGLDARG